MRNTPVVLKQLPALVHSVVRYVAQPLARVPNLPFWHLIPK